MSLLENVDRSKLLSQEKPTPIKIMLVDDHQLFREGIRILLEKHKQIQIIDEAEDGQEAIEKVRLTMPDVILMDINMPRLDGIEAAKRITKENPKIKIITVSFHTEPEIIDLVKSAGAQAYLNKDCSAEELLSAINSLYT